MKKGKVEETPKDNSPESTSPDQEKVSQTDNLEKPESQTDSDEDLAKDYLGSQEKEQEQKVERTAEARGTEEAEGEEKVDWRKRYADSTKEYQKYQQAINNLNRLAALNPKIYEEIESAQTMSGYQPTYTPPGGTLENLDVEVEKRVNAQLEPIRKLAQDLKAKEVWQRTQSLAEFEAKHPDLFPANASREEKKKIRGQVQAIAASLEAQGVVYRQALEHAALALNPQIATRKGRDEAYAEMFGESQAETTKVTSKEGKRPERPKYTQRELEIAKKLGEPVYKSMLKEMQK